MKCQVITVFKAGEGSGLLALLKKKATCGETEPTDQINDDSKGVCVLEEDRPEVCQSGLQRPGRVLEVEACLEAAAQRQVPQQRRASLPPAAYKTLAVAHTSSTRPTAVPHVRIGLRASL